MKKFYFILLTFLFFTFLIFTVNPKTVRISRDKTLLKDGPGNFYDTILILRIGTLVDYLEKSKEDLKWIQVSYNNTKGFISESALIEMSVKKEALSGLDLSDIDKKIKEQIAPASYTAAIKGFASNYSKEKGYSQLNLDELFKITEFNKQDYINIMKATKLFYSPKEEELIGFKESYINQWMMAFGLSASLSVLQQGVVMDEQKTKNINVIANILNRQTWDYDTRYRAWIINDDEPVAFSGPGGYIFISNKLLSLLTDYRELVAIIAHEIGHIALRHGFKDAAIEQIKLEVKKALEKLQNERNEEELELSNENKKVIEKIMNIRALIRDYKEEFISDQISLEILKRYKISGKYLVIALGKIYKSLSDKSPELKIQILKRIEKLKETK